MGRSSPAKVLRSAKRMTYFLRKKSINVCPAPCLSISTNLEKPPPKKLDQLPNELMLIFKDLEKQRQKEREIDKLQREKERREDLENFEFETKRSLEKLKIDLSLPP